MERRGEAFKGWALSDEDTVRRCSDKGDDPQYTVRDLDTSLTISLPVPAAGEVPVAINEDLESPDVDKMKHQLLTAGSNGQTWICHC